jgi:Domain of unknown function (DUF3291)
LGSTHTNPPGQAAHSPDNLATVLLRDRRNTFWTTTIWTLDAAMKAFMLSGPHRDAMRKLPIWCGEAAVANWTQHSAKIPTWPEAHARLQSEGRKSKGNNPSAVHLAHQFPVPSIHTAGELRFE